MATRMISLDTSSTITGCAFWENAVLTDSGILYHENEKNTIIRIEDMTIDIIRYLSDHKPDIVVIEQPPFCNSPKTCVMLAEIVGCAKGYAISTGADFVEYSVSEWRKLVAGPDEKIPRNRNEAKEWDINKVESIFQKEVEDDNEADAILIGLARIRQFETINLCSTSKKNF